MTAPIASTSRARTVRPSVLVGAGALAGALAGLAALAGPLDPPAGPVGPTHKTLSEVEPRVAISAENTPGDADSLFRITRAGSYYLTGDIAGVAGRSGIEIGVGGVTLDLMGFDLAGVSGSLDGVSLGGSRPVSVAVRNGSVRGWGEDGIDLGAATGTVVSEVRAVSNTGDGIVGGSVGTITACVAADNGLSGIVGGASSMIVECVADGNGGASTGLSEGIFAGDGSTVIGCTSQNNTSAIFGGVGDRGMGFRVGNRCVVRDCAASRNLGHGFRLLARSSISGCSASDNGSGSTVSAGIYLAGADNRVDGNEANTSDVGVQAALAGNIITRNVASGNGANYSFVADNVYGPIVDRRIPTTVPTTPAVNGSAAASTLGTTDPGANFAY